MSDKFPKYQQYFHRNKLEKWLQYVVIADTGKIKDYNDLNNVVIVMKTIINLFDKDFDKLIESCLNPSKNYIIFW